MKRFLFGWLGAILLLTLAGFALVGCTEKSYVVNPFCAPCKPDTVKVGPPPQDTCGRGHQKGKGETK